MSTNRWLAVIGGLIGACLCISSIAGGAAFFAVRGYLQDNPLPTPRVETLATATSGPLATARPASTGTAPTTAAPTAAPTPANQAPIDTAMTDAVVNNALPREDLVDIAVRYKGVPAGTKVECAVRRPEPNVGDRREFTLTNADTDTLFKITAELRHKGANVYAWVEVQPTALKIDQGRLDRAMKRFSEEIIPKSRAFFGSEANPGVDCDPRIHIMHASGIGSRVGGYFATIDSLPKAVREDSNEAEMYVMHAAPRFNGADPGSDVYISTLAHEFQHMISHNTTRSAQQWLEEGASELAARLNGFRPEESKGMSAFARKPETMLTVWDEDSPDGNGRFYNAGYLWWAYAYDRFGPDITRALAREPNRSTPGFMAALAKAGVTNPDTGKAYTFAELFADWVVANYNGSSKIAGSAANRYNYADTEMPAMNSKARLNASDLPVTRRETLSQFGTHYFDLSGNRAVELSFKGDTRVGLLPAPGATGAFWWSGRGDASNPRLTRSVDLSTVKGPVSLKFRAWYRLEVDYDYAYVSASEDGVTWKTLKSSSCTTTSPTKANLGCGFNDSSGGKGATPVWRDESVDLSAYAGKKVQLRFEMVTDAAVNREGVAIDNLQIPEIGYNDSVDNDAGWKAEGWVRTNNVLPQSFAVQVITIRTDGSRALKRITLNADNAGTLALETGTPGVRNVIIAISPTAPVTTEQANYSFTLK
jgi:immune inhibitor A